MHKTKLLNVRRRCGYLLLATLTFALLAGFPARASLIMSVQNTTAALPSSGNAFDVTLLNTGPSAVTIGGFSFVVTTADTFIRFTSTTIATTTAPYIFTGQSLFGPIISTDAPGQTMDGSDLFATIGGGTTLGAGVTVGLGHVFFSVLAGDTSGLKTVTLTPFPATSLSDPSGNNITVGTLTPGTITIVSTAVPEPSTLGLLLMGLPALAWAARRARRVS